MDVLYLLIPLSAVLVLGILGVFGWALFRGQFEELEHEGERILDAETAAIDDDQVPARSATQQSPPTSNRL